MAIDLVTIAAGTGGFALRGATAGALAGFSVSSAGDVNADGFEDYIIGAPFADAFIDFGSPIRFGAGLSYLVLGQGSGFGTVELSGALFGLGSFAIKGE